MVDSNRLHDTLPPQHRAVMATTAKHHGSHNPGKTRRLPPSWCYSPIWKHVDSPARTVAQNGAACMFLSSWKDRGKSLLPPNLQSDVKEKYIVLGTDSLRHGAALALVFISAALRLASRICHPLVKLAQHECHVPPQQNSRPRVTCGLVSALSTGRSPDLGPVIDVIMRSTPRVYFNPLPRPHASDGAGKNSLLLHTVTTVPWHLLYIVLFIFPFLSRTAKSSTAGKMNDPGLDEPIKNNAEANLRETGKEERSQEEAQEDEDTFVKPRFVRCRDTLLTSTSS